MSSHSHRTTLVIGNIHCPTCVSKIESIFAGYQAPDEKHRSSARKSLNRIAGSLTPRSRSSSPSSSTLVEEEADNKLWTPAYTRVDVSPINGTVSFDHSPDASIKLLIAELEDAGFDVIRTDATTDLEGNEARHLRSSQTSQSKWSRFSDIFTFSRDRQKAHRDNCEACREEEDARTEREQQSRKSKTSDVGASAGHETSEQEGLEEPLRQGIFAIEGMTCASCTSAIQSALAPEKTPGVSSVQVILVDNSATVVYDPTVISEKEIVETIEDAGYNAKFISSKSIINSSRLSPQGPVKQSKPQGLLYRVNVSIGGMTCASCVGAIGNMLKTMKGVKDYNVNLMSSSGYAVVEDRSLAPSIASEIEDLGYEAKIMSVEPVKDDSREKGIGLENQRPARTVHVKIEGFFCEHCPAKANKVLEDLAKRFKVEYTPSSLDRPVSTLTYYANPPEFTLRTIRRAIAELGFTMTIEKPETSQDRARKAQARERKRILLRLAVCTIFCIPTFVIGVVFASLLPDDSPTKMYWHHPVWGGASRITVSLFALATPIQFGIGQFFYERAYKSLRGVWRRRKGKVDMRKVWIDRLLRWGSMDTLVALGTTIAWASSLAYTILDIIGLGSGEMAYFDTSVFLMTFILAGRYLESISKAHTGDAITELGKLRPKKGLLYEDGKPTEEVESAFVEVGDRLLVPVGMSPPVDCRFAEGSQATSFDEASLTGESRPAGKKVGDTVYAGTYNTGPSAAIVIAETHDGETVIDSIASGVRDAMSKKASIERFADAVTAIFVPFIVGASILVFTLWMLRAYSGHVPEEWLDDQKAGGWTLFALQFTVATLIVACPCGLGLAAPTAQYVGVGLAARNGIMPNGGGEAFQAFTHVDAIAFDKTGTITIGKFQVSDNELLGVLPEKDLWGLISVVEQASNHPVARAIDLSALEKIKNLGSKETLSRPKVLDMEEVPGRGMKAKVKLQDKLTYEALIGNEKLLIENGCDVSSENSQLLQAWQGQGKSVVLVAVKDIGDSKAKQKYRIAALLAVADPLRPEARFVLDYFKSKGIATYIVSGDGPATVKAVARVLDLPEERVVGGALPEDKRRFVEQLQSQTKEIRGWNGRLQSKHKLVAFVGDGINDSIALAQADVSIAQGGGSHAATATADFALISESLLSIITLQAIARATYRRIISNFCWACVYNIVLIPLAAGAFYDLGRTKLPAVWASLAMALSSVSVVTNSLLLRYTFRVPREVKRFRDQC